MYKNKHTNEVWKLDRTETVSGAVVYVFENGDRWAADLFFEHFVKVED